MMYTRKKEDPKPNGKIRLTSVGTYGFFTLNKWKTGRKDK